MSTSDAYVRIMCDTCNEEEEAELPFMYPDYSGRNGRYDHTKPILPRGWKCVGDDRHECPDCIEARSDAA